MNKKVINGCLIALVISVAATPLTISRIPIENLTSNTAAQEILAADTNSFAPVQPTKELPENMFCIYKQNNRINIPVQVIKVSTMEGNTGEFQSSNVPAMQVTSLNAIVSNLDLLYISEQVDVTKKIYDELINSVNFREYINSLGRDAILYTPIDTVWSDYTVAELYTLSANSQLVELLKGGLVELTIDVPHMQDGEEVDFILMEDCRKGARLDTEIVKDGQVTISTRANGTLMVLTKTKM